MGNIFRALIVMPLFNILILIYALLPGHDFGLSIILFTVIIRILLWPLVKKQVHQQKAIRELQPELAKVRKKAKGDKQKEAQLMMELYREREINPLASLGTMLVQLPILITLFLMLRNLLGATELEAIREQFVNNSYAPVQDIPFIRNIIDNPGQFTTELFGVIELHSPSVVLAVTAAIGQFLQARQLQPHSGDSKRLRDILNEAKEGKEPNKGEQNAAMMRSMSKIFPFVTFFVALSLPSALALYWTTSSFIAAFQQRIALSHEVQLLRKILPQSSQAKKQNGSEQASAKKSKSASSQKKKSNTKNKSQKASNKKEK